MQTDSSLGIVHQNKIKRQSALAESDSKLRAIIVEACEDAGLADGKTASIVKGAMARFIIGGDGQPKPLSSFPTIDDFIQHHKTQAPSPVRSAIEAADQRAMKKAELHEQLKYYAEQGNALMYRKIRAELAAL